MPRQDLIQVRRDTAANWTSANPTLASGEIGYETDTKRLKIGNGSSTWAQLTYSGGAAKVSDTAPTLPNIGDQWYESDTGKLFIYYDSFWVEALGSTVGQLGPTGPTGPQVTGPTGPKGVADATFTITGTLVTGPRSPRYYVTETLAIVNVIASVSTAPTGASVIFDVNKNGTTIFSTQANRPTIAISGFYDGSSIPDVTSLAAGDYLTVDVDQVGSTIAGADAVIRIVFT